jgi:hypothetical protein
VLRSLATIAIFAIVVWGFVSYPWYVTPLVFMVATSVAGVMVATRPSYPWVRAGRIIETAVILGATIFWMMRIK